MRKISFLTISLVAALFLVGANSSAPVSPNSSHPLKPMMKRYKIKSGIIEYKLTGVNSGKEIVYFDNWGMLEAKYTKTVMSMMGMTQKTNTLTLLDGEWTYNIDLDTNTGTKMATPLFQELQKNAKNQDLTDVGKKMMEDMGGKKIGMEKLLGKLCEVWEIKAAYSKTWIWNGVAFKIEAGLGNMKMNSEAVSAKFNVPIPKAKVTLPKGAKIREMQNPMQNRMMPGKMFK
ncbi:MAG: hypothetical protein DWQ05_06110 [Calditrichaeota bacterium]|nr:MAG: hypothetical protein DWQ05_06110 [Calditrichota bacterium]